MFQFHARPRRAPRRRAIRLLRKLLIPFGMVSLATFMLSVILTTPTALLPSAFTFLFLIIYFLLISKKVSKTRSEPSSLSAWFIGIGYMVVTLFISFVYLYTSYRDTSDFVIWILFLLPIGITSYWGTTEGAFLGIAFSSLWVFGLSVMAALKAAPSAVNASVIDAHARLFTPPILLAIFGISTMIILKMLLWEIARGIAVRDVLLKLSSFEDPKQLSIEVANYIKDILRIDIVHVMFWNEDAQRLTVVGGAGKDKKDWQGLQVAKRIGITGQVLETSSPISAPNVKSNKSYWCPSDAYKDVQSELAVPIGKSPAYGVLDFESPHLDEFSSEDERTAEALGAAIGIAFQHDQAKKNLDWDWLNSLGETMEEVGVSVESLFYQVAERALDGLFDQKPELVVLYELTPETGGYPRVPPSYYPPNAIKHPDKMADPPWNWSPNNVLFRLINEWKFKKALDSKGASCFRAGEYDFVQREDIVSTVFLPIGDKSAKLGALFFDYRRTAGLSKNDLKAMQLIGQALGQRLQECWQLRQLKRTSRRIPSQVHEEVLGKQLPAIQNKLKNILTELTRRNAPEPSRIIQMVHDAIQYAGAEFQENAEMAAHGLLWDVSRPAREILAKTSDSIERSRNREPRCEPEVSDRANAVLQKYQFLKEAICCFVAEAMINSVEHGKASKVSGNVSLKDNILELIVHDNGTGFDPTPFESGKREIGKQGVWEWKKILETDFGAKEVRIESALGSGTHIEARIPLLIQEEEDA